MQWHCPSAPQPSPVLPRGSHWHCPLGTPGSGAGGHTDRAFSTSPLPTGDAASPPPRDTHLGTALPAAGPPRSRVSTYGGHPKKVSWGGGTPKITARPHPGVPPAPLAEAPAVPRGAGAARGLPVRVLEAGLGLPAEGTRGGVSPCRCPQGCRGLGGGTYWVSPWGPWQGQGWQSFGVPRVASP